MVIQDEQNLYQKTKNNNYYFVKTGMLLLYLMYIFNNLSYEGQRELAFYFYEMNKEKENNQILQRKYDEVN